MSSASCVRPSLRASLKVSRKSSRRTPTTGIINSAFGKIKALFRSFASFGAGVGVVGFIISGVGDAAKGAGVGVPAFGDGGETEAVGAAGVGAFLLETATFEVSSAQAAANVKIPANKHVRVKPRKAFFKFNILKFYEAFPCGDKISRPEKRAKAKFSRFNFAFPVFSLYFFDLCAVLTPDRFQLSFARYKTGEIDRCRVAIYHFLSPKEC
jgi:hypothetical protein